MRLKWTEHTTHPHLQQNKVIINGLICYLHIIFVFVNKIRRTKNGIIIILNLRHQKIRSLGL